MIWRTLFILHLCLAASIVRAQVKVVSLGENSHFQYDLSKGTYDLIFDGRMVIKGAYAVCKSGDRMDSSISYTTRRWSVVRHNGQKAYRVTATAAGRPVMIQEFGVDKKKKSFATIVRIKAAGSNYMSPLTCDQVDIQEQGDDRALLVPFDNDAWVRYNAVPLTSADFTSSEVTALYSNDSRHGLIVGALMQRDWKTGIRVKGEGPGRLSHLSAFGGYTDKTYTHDVKEHGKVVGVGNEGCMSPFIVVGWFDDWRTGLETYAATDDMLPSVAGKWTGATPFGWNSWGAMQDKLTLPKAKAVVDFFYDSCEYFRTADSNLDK